MYLDYKVIIKTKKEYLRVKNILLSKGYYISTNSTFSLILRTKQNCIQLAKRF